MIESILLNYLKSELSVPCRLEVQEELPTYVLIEKTGGSITNRIKSATIAIQSYALSMYEAAQLNEEVITKMLDSVKLDSISRCELNSNYNFTDTAKKHYRYQAVFDLVFFD